MSPSLCVFILEIAGQARDEGTSPEETGHTKELCRPYGANHNYALFHGGLRAPPMLCRPYGANHSYALFHGGLRAPPMLCRPYGANHSYALFHGDSRAPPMLCRPYGLIIAIHYALYTIHYTLCTINYLHSPYFFRIFWVVTLPLLSTVRLMNTPLVGVMTRAPERL